MEMPPAGRLPERQIELLAEWVRRGAPDPRIEVPAARLQPVDWEAGRKHWAFQPVPHVVPPEEPDAGWATNPIDRFIRSRLRQEGLEPSPVADRRTLIRRATFDLTGLPPTPEETAAFVNDPAADAFERVVERLLVLGPKMLAEQDKEKMLIDIVDEQVDTISRTMLGLTLSCARCHDHKFDPQSARDY